MRCHSCFQHIPDLTKLRICLQCKRPIARHDKYICVTSRGSTKLQHRHCDNPTDYFSSSERKERKERKEREARRGNSQ